MPSIQDFTSNTAQTRILRTFTILHALCPNWGGQLILSIGLNPQGAALSLASNIAGAVCLSLESDPTLLREANRTNSCDFIVNTLDEALRAIKNEVRKHLPLSVGLEGNPTTLLHQILDRGVAPQLFTGASSHPEAAYRFQSLGTQIVEFNDASPTSPTPSSSTLLEAFLATHPWHLQTFTFNTPTELRTFDARALSLISTEGETNNENNLRRRWLQAAPRILPRERHRTLWLTQQENETLKSEQP